MSATFISEEQILKALHRLPDNQWAEVLNFIDSLQVVKREDRTPSPTSLEKKWTADELLKLPPQEREAILAAQAAQAEEEYRTNPELTAFEAFGKDDLYGECSDAQTR